MKRVNQILAVLLTLLMLVTAVPFAAFATGETTTTDPDPRTPEQKACQHTWSNDLSLSVAELKTKADCIHRAVYYKNCSKCHVSAMYVPGAENQTKEYGNEDNTNHAGPIVPVNADVKDKKPCQEITATPGQKCSACNTVIEEPVTYTTLQQHQVAPGKEPNCQTEGFCRWCGIKIAEKDPNNHPKDQVRIVEAAVEPTCDKAGKTARIYCRACDKFQEPTTISATGNHTLTAHQAVASNCTDHGTKAYWECSKCKKLFSDAEGKNVITAPQEEALDAAKHKNLKKVNKQDATCTAEGNIEYWHCDGCGKYYSDDKGTTEIQQSATVIEKKPHTWGKMTLISGNCETGGKATHECAVCHIKEEVTIAAGKHPADAQKTKEGKAATCTEAGKTEEISCELCGTITKPATDIPALGHDYTNAKATGKGDGTHTLECTRCHQAGDPVPCTDENKDCTCDVCKQQLAHVFTNYVSDNNATCAADGTKTAICDVCGKAKDQVTDEGSKASAQHQYVWTELNDATCIANGHRKGVCRICEAETIEEIADSATGHVDSDWKYPAGYDCEVGGVRYRECTVCGQTTVTENIESRPHSEVIDPEVPKTCTTDGKSAGVHCDVCGKIITPQVIYTAEGHKADENGFVTTKKATCTETGLRSATCGVCGQSFTETLPATGHSYVDSVVKPTCTSAGYTLHKCSVCGEETQTNISPATGHKMVEKIRPATTSENGKVVQTCSVCGAKEAYRVYRIKKIVLSQTSFVRDSKSHKPSVTITDAKGNKLVKKTDYTLKFASGRKAVGTYTVTVTFKGEYSGKKTLKFKIVPPAVKNLKAKAGYKSAALTWDRNKFADTYVVYCATAKDGKYKKLGSTTKLGYTVTGLKTGTYYFKVVAVRKLDTGNFKSAASAIRKVNVK